MNLTPDSFSDGGRFDGVDQAVAEALRLIDAGADLIDVGGESTRPGARAVSVEQELDRVIGVISALADRVAVPISIDTSKPEVMRAAVAAGACLINDVRALGAPGALEAAADLAVPVVLMHMQGEPAGMQEAPSYQDVVAEVQRFLAERVFACEMAGIEKSRLLIDPGFGFGKTLEHNLALLSRLNSLSDLQCPILVGLSRKRMIGEITGRAVSERAVGSAAAALIAVQHGAAVVRVHDVAATRDALALWSAVAPLRAPRRQAPAAPRGSSRWAEDD